MKVLVTGSSGHLGEALMRQLPGLGHESVGLDAVAGGYTDIVGSVVDRQIVERAMAGVEAVLHTATLHKHHVATHAKQAFIDTNVSGTLALLEAAVEQGVGQFVFTSTTSAFGAALVPAADAPAAWIDETVATVPKNIYGATKTAAEDLCALFARKHGLNCTVLRTSRFFPEVDDSPAIRDVFGDQNAKANEFLFRRVDLEDAVSAHICALGSSPPDGFARYVISATSPFTQDQLRVIRRDPAQVISKFYPNFFEVYDRIGYRMFPDISRVYVNDRARAELGWKPQYDFARVLGQLAAGEPIGSDLARDVGIKGYHGREFSDGVYPTD